ncbi:uncharacterized protein LOC142973015 [Anticarsia gemmatalis]|uniref:uncharacterized protein LOC142973015 n=1 Tax=Anticarsia gemmatalis TaxID=129554 RepID=UPI003F75C89F
MGSLNKLILLFMLTCSYGYGDKPYRVIKFKIPQSVWQQALHPTPVLKSSVTVPITVHVQSNEVEDEVDNADEEVNVETVVNDTNVTEVLADPVPVVSDPPPPVVTQKPPLQAEVVTNAPPVPGQVIRFPCECRNGQCGCCTGALMERFRMKACGNLTFIPEDFVFDVKLNVNNNTVVHRRVSASDPPPICFNPRRAPFVRVCAEISNIQIRNRNAHACFDINADIGGFPVFEAPFRCFSFGSSGLQSGKKPRPVSSSGPKPVNLFGSGNNDDDEGGFLENAFGEGGLLGGGGSSDDGPFDGIGDAIGDFFDFE